MEKLFFIVLFVLLVYIKGEVKIIGPSSVYQEAKSLEPSGIRSQLGNFGQVPYGSSIVGKVLLQKNTDETNLWCDYSKTVSIPQTSDEYVPIILVDHSTDCHYTQKALNVQKRGGSMMIIISDNDSMMESYNFDDQVGDRVDIPSIILSKKIGDLFKEYLSNSSNKDPITISIKFSGVKKDGSIDIDLFFGSDDAIALNFFREFSPFYELLDKKLHFRPVYKYYIYLNEETDNSLSVDSNIRCFKNQKYCVGSSKDFNITNPRIPLLENIRQSCIYTLFELPVYWNYMMTFAKDCADVVNPSFTPECSLSTIKAIGIEQNEDKINECMKDMIEKDSKVNDDYNLYNQKRVFKVPELMINGVKYRGTWYSKYIFNSICSGFIDDDSICKPKKTEPPSSFTGMKLIGIVAIGLFVVTIISLICYRRFVNKSLETSLSEKIEQQTMVSIGQYNIMKDQKQ